MRSLFRQTLSWAHDRTVVFAVVAVSIQAMVWRGNTAEPASIDFNRQILPILSDNCFACHGPDDAKRKAHLRLDLGEAAQAKNEYGEQAVAPGDVEASLLVRRITTEDELDLMPPPSTGKRLTAEQVTLLKRWVEAGAPYERHWSFAAPSRPPLPEVKRKGWVSNEIDAFVLARLESEGIQPAKRANKRTLARRVSLDLTGLPPSPKEIETFLNDKSPEAYERLVDRLMSSPRYGEHQAKAWMDAARYADSHGYHIDAERHMWKWRDWVIGAFNDNMPFDQFTTEQIAGDLVPEASESQKVASGYLRANMSTGEGGAIEEEYQAKYTFDRAETTSTIWLGLTMTCARCHTHKYDPLTQREYFQFYAFFNNLDEAVMDGNRPDPDPTLRLPTPGQRERLEELAENIRQTEESLSRPRPEQEAARNAWFAAWRQRVLAGLEVLRPSEVTTRAASEFEMQEDGLVSLAGGEPETEVRELTVPIQAGQLGGVRVEFLLPEEPTAAAAIGEADVSSPKFRITDLELAVVDSAASSPQGRELKIAGFYATSWAEGQGPEKMGDGDRASGWSPDTTGHPATQELFFRLEKPAELGEGSELRLRFRQARGSQWIAPKRFRLWAVRGQDVMALLQPPSSPPWKLLGPFAAPDPTQGLATSYGPEASLEWERKYEGVKGEIAWQDRGDLPDGRRHLLVNSLHGVHGVFYLTRVLNLAEERQVNFRLRADDVFRFWVDGDVVAERLEAAEPGEGPVQVTLTLGPGEHRLLIKTANLQGDAFFAFDQDVQEPQSISDDAVARLLVMPSWDGNNVTAVRRQFLRGADAEWRAMDNQVAVWRQAREEVEQAVVTTMVAKERTEPRETHLLLRGEYDKPGDLVRPGVPAIFPGLPATAPPNRLGLAQWLLSPDHPLTARVTVNRFWQQLFGTGLVKTAGDFGVQGERPSHPELLDWLAVEFRESGWDVKRLLRTVVLSSTYRQVSNWREDVAERDPENRWLARGARFRADAEVLRDVALAVSGLLVEEVGGRSVKPFEPSGLWEAVSFNNSQKYVQDLGEANYRRSLYTHWKRQSPPPSMLIFDAPTREYCVVRRPRTNTPLQAMVLLNDPQFVEASRAFGWRLMTEGGDRVPARIRYGFLLATSRRPHPDEIEILARLYRQQLADFRERPEAAAALVAVGGWQPEGECDAAEWAAWTTVASLLLNLDETLTKG